MTLQERVKQLVDQHGGLRKAARAMRIEPGYLCRLGSGKKTRPEAEVLHRLGLRVVVDYQLLPSVDGGLTQCDMHEDESY